MFEEEDLCEGLAKAFCLEERLTVDKLRALEQALGAGALSCSLWPDYFN